MNVARPVFGQRLPTVSILPLIYGLSIPTSFFPCRLGEGGLLAGGEASIYPQVHAQR